MKLKTVDINKKISEKNVKWTAKDNHISKMAEKDRKKLLGFIPEKEDDTLKKSLSEPLLGFSNEVDWRTSGNVTSIKNQKNCGSCVSFATVAAMESLVSIYKNQTVDLSEADLHFCSSHGPTCDGWNLSGGFSESKNRGVCDENCAPYGTGTPVCNPCVDRDSRIYKFINYYSSSSTSYVKNHLTNIGPVVAGFDVYSDFYNYDSGVYSHVVGTYEGGHAIEIVGYSENEQCWICKNSWGETWGDNGFFKIAYGNCNIDYYSKYCPTGVYAPGDIIPPTTTTTTTTVKPTTTTTTVTPTTTTTTVTPTTTTTTVTPTTTTTTVKPTTTTTTVKPTTTTTTVKPTTTTTTLTPTTTTTTIRVSPVTSTTTTTKNKGKGKNKLWNFIKNLCC